MTLHQKITYLFLAITMGAVFLVLNKNQSKIVFVDQDVIMKDFKMIHDLNASLNQQNEIKKRSIDSLYNSLENSDASFRKDIMSEIILRKNELEESSNKFYIDQTQKIRKRIESYGEQFVKDNGYDFLLESHGNSGLIYATDANNKTNEFLLYINKKYEGGK